jgi:uncharacterized protein YhbP (UPF0306 family)
MPLKTVRRTLRNPKVAGSIQSILRRNVLCSMATVTPGGIAHINTAYFAFSPKLEFCFFSFPDSRHARNLLRNSSMSMAVFDSNQHWGRPDRGLQLFGRCRVASALWKTRMTTLYAHRFPGFWKWQRAVEREGGAFPLNVYRFVPTELKLFDERIFGRGIFVRVRIPRMEKGDFLPQ